MPTVRCSVCGRRLSFRGLAVTCACGNVVSASDAEAGSPSSGGFEDPMSASSYGTFDDPAPYVPRRSFKRKRNKLWPVLIVAFVVLGFMFLAVELIRRQIDQRDVVANEAVSNLGTSGASPVVLETTPLPSSPPPPEPEPVEPAADSPAATALPAPDPDEPRPLFYELSQLVPAPSPAAVEHVSDERVQQSIAKGINFLVNSFATGELSKIGEKSDPRPIGEFALCAYALMHAAHASNDPRLGPQSETARGILEKLKLLPMEEQFPTYSRSIRLAALAVYNRREDRTAMLRDLQWLLDASIDGGYTYVMPEPEKRRAKLWDNSNSQYGLLGVWAAADAGLPVPSSYWEAVEKHWLSTQNEDGGWPYSAHQDNSRFTMTCAGVTSLFVVRDQLRSSERSGPFPSELRRGLENLAQNPDLVRGPKNSGYTLFGLERTALASGYKYFGELHWYKDHAAHVVKTQRGDGSWEGQKTEGNLVRTAFSLLFLARGQSPMFVNKLRFDGAWQNRPRDVAGLVAFASKQLERPLNWQIVDIDRTWRDWMDSPVLYITSHQKIDWTEEQIRNLRDFALAGGLIYTQADSGAEAFTQFIESLAAQLFPEYPLQPVPESHPVYNIVFRVKNKPPLMAVSNGTRLLLVHSPTDTTVLRELQAGRAFRLDQELGVNVGVYASGKQDLHHRLDSSVVSRPGADPQAIIPVARLRYDGNWNPEPMAWERMDNIMRNRANIGLDLRPTDVDKLQYEQTPVAHLTGTGKYPLADPVAIRRFVEAGGVLLIDPAGGDPTFVPSIVERLLPIAFPKVPLVPLGDDHPLITGGIVPGTEDLTKPLLRPYVLETLGRDVPPLRMLRHGKGAILVSDLDITTGILSAYTWGINGYQPAYAEKLAKNVLLWAIKGEDRPQ